MLDRLPDSSFFLHQHTMQLFFLCFSGLPNRVFLASISMWRHCQFYRPNGIVETWVPFWNTALARLGRAIHCGSKRAAPLGGWDIFTQREERAS